jgi:hypothetical protein
MTEILYVCDDCANHSPEACVEALESGVIQEMREALDALLDDCELSASPAVADYARAALAKLGQKP